MSLAEHDNIYTLRNSRDMRISISDRGASLISWWSPDRYGRLADVLLGYPDSDAYIQNPYYFGAIVGRWANRISGGAFTLDGTEFKVDSNDGQHHLHGGTGGFHQARWQVQEDEEDGSLRFHLRSPAGTRNASRVQDMQRHRRRAYVRARSALYRSTSELTFQDPRERPGSPTRRRIDCCRRG